MTAEKQKAVRQVMAGIVESAIAGESFGAPAGPLYAALMTQGCTLNQFQTLTDSMVNAGILTKRGDCFFPTQRGLDWLEIVDGKSGLRRENLHGVQS